MSDSERYDLVSRCLHWTVAALMIALLWLGWYLGGLSYYDRWFYTSLEWHKALGMLALVIGVANICWAVGRRTPMPPATMAEWERAAARAVHVILFAMMMAIPVTGYVISTSAGDGVSMFGWFQVPAILPSSERLRDLAVELHYYLAYITAALVLLHVLGALKHLLVDRDQVLRRML